eukprot:Opistho-1_new@107790
MEGAGEGERSVLFERIDAWLQWIEENPTDFFTYLVAIIAPLMMLSGLMTYKLLQMIDAEEAAKERAARKEQSEGHKGSKKAASDDTASSSSATSASGKKSKSKKAD